MHSCSTITLVITDREGVERFAFTPESGTPYSGGVGCTSRYKTETVIFAQMPYPLDAAVTDCSGEKTEFTIPKLGDYDNFNPPRPSEALREGGPRPSAPESEDIGPTPERQDRLEQLDQLDGDAIPEGFGPSPEELEALEQFRQLQEDSSIPGGFEAPEGFEDFIPDASQSPGGGVNFLASITHFLFGLIGQ